MRAYIGLGANLGNPAAQVRGALASLASHPALRLVATSRLYQSQPLGPPGQAEYCNAVCSVETELPPEALLEILQEIEVGAGRTRDGIRWAARTLDLDLLHVEGEIRDTPSLQLPHRRLGERNFVLVPLEEVAPCLFIPGLGAVAEVARKTGRDGLRPWPEADAPEGSGGLETA